jgi:hypothetical protein
LEGNCLLAPAEFNASSVDTRLTTENVVELLLGAGVSSFSGFAETAKTSGFAGAGWSLGGYRTTLYIIQDCFIAAFGGVSVSVWCRCQGTASTAFVNQITELSSATEGALERSLRRII